MSNEKRFVVKHGLQSQNMEFVSPDKAKRISVSMLDSGTISFSGDSGELFSVTDTMSGTIFAVNDISGIPSLEVDDDGIVRIAESVGNVLIGTATDNGNKLQVNGTISANNVTITGALSANGSIGTTGQTLRSDGTKSFWSTEVGYTGSQGRISTDASVPPTPLYEGQIWFDTTNLKTYVYYDSFWIEVGGSELGTLYYRRGFTASTSTLANDASENINISGYKSYVLMTVSTSHACWVRIYSDQAARTADETRLINVDPTSGSGVIAEFVTTGNQTLKITPFIFGGNLESVPIDDLYLRVTNLSGSSTSINISVLLTRLEI